MHKSARRDALALSALSLFLGFGIARAEDKTYVQVPGVPGESTDVAHATWIDAYALDAGADRSFPAGGGSTIAWGDVSILKGTDKATPLLNDLLARGVPAGTVVIDVCRQTSPQQCYYRIELSSTFISSIDLSGSSCVGTGACTPSQTESVSFKYTRIKWTYTPFSGGTPGTPVTRCFDLASNQAC